MIAEMLEVCIFLDARMCLFFLVWLGMRGPVHDGQNDVQLMWLLSLSAMNDNIFAQQREVTEQDPHRSDRV